MLFRDMKDAFIKNTLNEDLFKDRQAAKFQNKARQMGLHHVGYGNYANTQGEVTHRKSGRELLPILNAKQKNDKKIQKMLDDLHRLINTKTSLENKLKEIDEKINQYKVEIERLGGNRV